MASFYSYVVPRRPVYKIKFLNYRMRTRNKLYKILGEECKIVVIKILLQLLNKYNLPEACTQFLNRGKKVGGKFWTPPFNFCFRGIRIFFIMCKNMIFKI